MIQIEANSIQVSSQIVIGASDPFFEVYQFMQSLRADQLINRGSFKEDQVNSLPLTEDKISGCCCYFTDFAKISLHRAYDIPDEQLVRHSIYNLMDFAQPKDRGGHAILYIVDGGGFLNPKSDSDIFFDGTSAQFSKLTSPTPLYINLAKYGGKLGVQMVKELFLRGYVEIPHSEFGSYKLGLLIAAYRTKREYPDLEEPIKVTPFELTRMSITSHLSPLYEDDGLFSAYKNITGHSFKYNREALSAPKRRIQSKSLWMSSGAEGHHPS